MTSLELVAVTKTFGRRGKVVVAVDDVSLDVSDGELFVLLGESGCGKTTLMRCIAGLEAVSSGSIRFGDSVVADPAAGVNVPPDQRRLGMVFQSYALWPHMTVRKNLAFPLRAHRQSKPESDRLVEAVAEIVQCASLLERYPGQLSGGQQQRIALGRALIARPSLVLFDEPLSNLDALLRRDLRNELHQLHEQLEFTGVYVTHDQVEALTIGDRIGVMSKGRILQTGTPTEVYHSPSTDYVAGFFGMSNTVALSALGTAQAIDPCFAKLGSGDDRTTLRFRPEQTRLASTGSAVPSTHVRIAEGTVTATSFAGHLSDTTIATAGGVIVARTALDRDEISSSPGIRVDVTVERSDIVAYVDGVLAGRPESPRRHEIGSPSIALS
jgi:iron(III) transport system ATP-binding protein